MRALKKARQKVRQTRAQIHKRRVERIMRQTSRICEEAQRQQQLTNALAAKAEAEKLLANTKASRPRVTAGRSKSRAALSVSIKATRSGLKGVKKVLEAADRHSGGLYDDMPGPRKK